MLLAEGALVRASSHVRDHAEVFGEAISVLVVKDKRLQRSIAECPEGTQRDPQAVLGGRTLEPLFGPAAQSGFAAVR